MLKKMLLLFRERGIGYLARIALLQEKLLLKSVFVYPFRKKTYTQALSEISLGDRVFLWAQDFGWNVPLFQRPQHIARCLAGKNCTVFYCTNCLKDPEVDSLLQVYPNLYLINRQNRVMMGMLEAYLQGVTKPKYLHLYSTHYKITLDEVQAYQRKGYRIFYEYIDDLAPEISGTREIPVNIKEIFEYVTRDSRIPMAVTADLLKTQVEALRGGENLAFSTNGVDLDHFRNIPEKVEFSREFQAVLQRNRKIVGYYGALAQWFDYTLLEHTARMLPDVSFVLIGKIYDGSFYRSGVQQLPNVFFVGAVPYAQLPAYAARFDVCMIPFRVNSITNATSPLKLFEYMAIGKPILTTAMHENAKYRSVHIAGNAEDFAAKLKMLLTYCPEQNPAYYAVLKQEAQENAWEGKADAILAMLKKQESVPQE